MIQVACQSCGTQSEVSNFLAGMTVRCKFCEKGWLQVPRDDANSNQIPSANPQDSRKKSTGSNSFKPAVEKDLLSSDENSKAVQVESIEGLQSNHNSQNEIAKATISTPETSVASVRRSDLALKDDRDPVDSNPKIPWTEFKRDRFAIWTTMASMFSVAMVILLIYSGVSSQKEFVKLSSYVVMMLVLSLIVNLYDWLRSDKNRPELIICEGGLIFGRSKKGLIAWKNIGQFRVLTHKNNQILYVDVAMPKKNAKKSSFLSMRLFGRDLGTRRFTESIVMENLNPSKTVLIEILEKCCYQKVEYEKNSVVNGLSMNVDNMTQTSSDAGFDG